MREWNRIAEQITVRIKRIAGGVDHFISQERDEFARGHDDAISDGNVELRIRLSEIELLIGLELRPAGAVNILAVAMDEPGIAAVHHVDSPAKIELILDRKSVV